MDNKNNQYLIVIKENFFEKIKKFFRKFLKKEKNEEIKYEPNKIELSEQDEYEKNKIKSYENYLSQKFENQEVIEDIDCYEETYETESYEKEEIPQCKTKEEFFELYEKVKNKEKSIEEVSTLDLIKMENMVKEEIALHTKSN